jgi:Uma2 family endonuclease
VRTGHIEEEQRMHMAARVKRWTLDELHSLPDDGNKYELIHGELLVTPAPSVDHETILARLSALLVPYVAQHRLGIVYHPRAVVRVRSSEAEPDLMVRQPPRGRLKNDWEKVPLPLLVIEVLSPYTRRRDYVHKRQWYQEIGVDEYWIVDAEDRAITVIRSGMDDVRVSETLQWQPAGADAPLELRVAQLFEEA